MFRILRALSLDVVLGGLAVASLSQRHFQANLPWAWWWILAGSIWIVYSLDRLLDARRLKTNASTFRHRFHYRYFYPVLLLVFIIGGIIFFLSLRFLSLQLWLAGLGLALFCLVYLGLAQWRNTYLPREPLIALGYAAGIVLGPVIYTHFNTNEFQIGPHWQSEIAFISLLFLAAMMNLLVFSRFEVLIDRRDGQTSLMQQMPHAPFYILIHTILLLQLLTWLWLVLHIQLSTHWQSAMVLLIVAPFPYTMLLTRHYFKKNDRYRIYGDGIFFLCALPALIEYLSLAWNSIMRGP